MKITLTKPLKHKDKELTELDLTLDDLTGQDMIDVEEEMKRKGITVNAWDYSRAYLIAIAARALKLPVEALRSLSARDFTLIVNETLNFFSAAASETVTERSSAK